jgi:hypothetical protein
MRNAGLIGLFFLLAACGSSSSSGSALDAGVVVDAATQPEPEPTPGADATVTAFDKKEVFFGGKNENRTVDAPATFPADGEYSKIILHLSLACPQSKCDWWDRFGTLGIVKGDTVVELARFITPYRLGAKWDIDVTSLRPLLKGDVTVRGFIDTWVGPGHANGNGWLLSASFEMTGGIPERVPVAVLPIWDRRSVPYGDPAKPIATTAAPKAIDLPANATAYDVRTFITGHGQGNAGNCAEFCAKKHTVTVEGKPHTQKLWRDDCKTTAVPNQLGNWEYGRAGWCPGATVLPWTFDATADLAGVTQPTFGYDVEAYTNTCRPDAVPDGGTCSACTLGSTCAYDDGNHTAPQYYVSSVLIAYR